MHDSFLMFLHHPLFYSPHNRLYDILSRLVNDKMIVATMMMMISASSYLDKKSCTQFLCVFEHLPSKFQAKFLKIIFGVFTKSEKFLFPTYFFFFFLKCNISEISRTSQLIQYNANMCILNDIHICTKEHNS